MALSIKKISSSVYLAITARAELSFIAVILFSTSMSFAQVETLGSLQRLALERNPRLKAMVSETLMMKSRILSVSSLEDPRVKLGINNVPTDSFSLSEEEMTSKEIGISQMIPLGGKLGIKKEIAAKEFDKAVLALKKEKSELLHMLRMKFFELNYLRDTIGIMKEIKLQIALLVKSEIAANKTGMGSLANVIKAETESAMADEEIIVLEQKEKETAERISYLVGSPVSIGKIADEPALKNAVYPAGDEAVGAVLAGNPDLKMLMADVSIVSSEISLAKSEFIPDMELGLSYMQRDSGPMGKRSDMVSGMVTFNIPAWFYKRNQPMLEEMKKKKSANEDILRNYKNYLRAQTLTVVSQVEKWKTLMKLYSERIIPQTELTLETLLSRYRTGKMEFMSVIDAVRMLLRYKKEFAMAEKEYFSGISELHMLMGGDIWP